MRDACTLHVVYYYLENIIVNSVKRSDFTGNRFEMEPGENKVI